MVASLGREGGEVGEGVRGGGGVLVVALSPEGCAGEGVRGRRDVVGVICNRRCWEVCGGEVSEFQH